MTAVYALTILLAFALATIGWLAVLLREARQDLEATRIEVDEALNLAVTRGLHIAANERCIRALQAISHIVTERTVLLRVEAARCRKERDDALGNLAMVLNNEDVAATLDMRELFRDAAPIVRHHFPLRAVR